MRLLPGEALTRAMAPTGWLLVILGEVVTRGSIDSCYDPNWLAACDSW